MARPAEKAQMRTSASERRSARRSKTRGSERGFSLLEITISVAFLASLTALAVTSLAPVTDRMRLRAEAREIANLIGAARTRAIVTGEVANVDLDAGHNHIVSGAPALIRQLPSSVLLRLAGGDGETGARQRIAFYPEGSASGGTFAIAGASRQIVIAVDWLTGRVSIGGEVADVR
jgi:general secretion pathway protein H